MHILMVIIDLLAIAAGAFGFLASVAAGLWFVTLQLPLALRCMDIALRFIGVSVAFVLLGVVIAHAAVF